MSRRIKELFIETAIQGGKASGGISGFEGGITKQSHAFHEHDRKRKVIERQGKNRSKRIEERAKEKQKLKEKIQAQFIDHPRNALSGEMKYTIKEAFGAYIAEYLKTGRHDKLDEAVKLMEEYPKLAKYVHETSIKYLPEQFSVFSHRSKLEEDKIGSLRERSGDTPHLWTCSRHQAAENANYNDNSILEAKVSRNKVLIYIQAFNPLLEQMIFKGKIEESADINILREAKRRNEIVLLPTVNQGVIVEFFKKG